MPPFIPILILNWNGIEDTIECLDSLSGQRYSNFHIYLIDNASDERNVQLLKEHFLDHPKVTLIFNDTNLGFTRGNNAVLEMILRPEAGFKYVALLNNDTVVEDDWLHQLVSCAEECDAGMVTSKMVNYFDRRLMDNAGHKMLNTAEILPIGHGQPAEAYTRRFENMGACAGAALYSVDMLRNIGIFDSYFETGYEDAELGLRAVVLGYKSLFEPKAVVYHKVSRSVRKVLSYSYLLKIQLNIFYSYFKLMPIPVLVVNLPFFLFKYSAILLIDIVFLRIRFLKIMVHAMYLTLFKERKKIMKSRRGVFQVHRPVPWLGILKKQEFFLWFDLKRFFKYILLNRPTPFEKY